MFFHWKFYLMVSFLFLQLYTYMYLQWIQVYTCSVRMNVWIYIQFNGIICQIYITLDTLAFSFKIICVLQIMDVFLVWIYMSRIFLFSLYNKMKIKKKNKHKDRRVYNLLKISDDQVLFLFIIFFFLPQNTILFLNSQELNSIYIFFYVYIHVYI